MIEISYTIQQIQDMIPQLLNELESRLTQAVDDILSPLQSLGFASWDLILSENDGLILSINHTNGEYLAWNVKTFEVENSSLSNIVMDESSYDVLDTVSNYILNKYQSALDNNLFGQPDSGVFVSGKIESRIDNNFGM